MQRFGDRWSLTQLLLTLILLSAPVIWGQKINTGYDKTADFSQFKTYAWAERHTPATDPILAAVIVANIDSELAKKGLRKTDSNPDLLINCYGGLGSESAFAAEDPGYTALGGTPLPGTSMWGGSVSSDAVMQVVQGMLVVDLVDTHQKHLVWRATAKANLDYDKRSKMFDQVNKAVVAIFKNYPPESK
jgi:Domain of unknown function (DUF4136)